MGHVTMQYHLVPIRIYIHPIISLHLKHSIDRMTDKTNMTSMVWHGAQPAAQTVWAVRHAAPAGQESITARVGQK